VLTVWVAVIVVLLWLARPVTEPLTLTVTPHWSPTVTLDTSQVEPEPEQDRCVAVDAETLTERVVDDLFTIGWFSDPTDGGEWVYSPECGTVR
jgi:hypothetical protein